MPLIVAMKRFFKPLAYVVRRLGGHVLGALGCATAVIIVSGILHDDTWMEHGALFFFTALVAWGFGWVMKMQPSEAESEQHKPLEAIFERIIEGDLSDEVFYIEENRQIEGPLYFMTRRLVLELRRVIGTFQRVSSELQNVSQNILDMSDNLSYSTREQSDSVSDVHNSLSASNKSITEIRDSIHNLTDVVANTSSAILEMTANIEEVTDSAKNLTTYVEETATAMQEMAASILGVSESAREIYARASDNAASMAQMDAAIEEVGESARTTSELGESARVSAEEGKDIVLKTSEGLRAIEQSVNDARSSVNVLGKQSGEIGKIIKVIKEIADRTNLLALNAAIIAAQAGKEGKSFAVVAEEIRELSERTSASVSDISTMVKSIQKEVGRSITLMESTTERVEEGVTLGNKAENSLHIIMERTQLAMENVSQIAKATAEQILGSRRITQTTDEIAGMIEQISSATDEQRNTSARIQKRASYMTDVTSHLFRAMEEQMGGSRSISEDMERLNAVVNSVEDAILQLSKGGETVLRATGTIKDTTQQNAASVRSLYATVSMFRQEALLLQDAISKFRLPEPKQGGILRLPINKNLDINFDPSFAQSVPIAEIVYNMFWGLVRYGEGTDIHPAIAKKWTISSDGLVYTFYLREEARFHDGSPVEAEDIRASFIRVLNPETHTPGAWALEPIKGAKAYHSGETNEPEGIRVVGKLVIELELESPIGFFLSYLTLPEAAIVPRHLAHKRGLDFNENPIGAGPFKLEAFVKGEVLKLTKHTEFFEENCPHVTGIEYYYSTSSEKHIDQLKDRHIDLSTRIGTDEIPELAKDPEWASNVIQGVQLQTTFIGLRNDVPPLNDKRVRQAMNYAVNKEVLNSSIHQGMHEVAKGILPPGILGYNPDQKGYDYNPDKARELLKEAGFGDGFKTVYHTVATRGMNEEITYILSCLSEVGIEVEIKILSEAESRQRGTSDRAPIFYSGWYADYPDPDNFFYSIFNSENQTLMGIHYSSEQLDILMEEARRESDLNVRERLYHKAEAILVEDAPVIFLYHQRAFVAAQSNLGGVKIHLTPPVIRPERIWIERLGQD